MEIQQTNATINNEKSKQLFIQVAHARLQEIIDLCLKV